MNNFVIQRDDLGKFDYTEIIKDTKVLVENSNTDWNIWQRDAVIVSHDTYNSMPATDLNLTSNENICPTLADRLWKYSGRRFSATKEVDDGDLHTILPELKGSYTESVIKSLTDKFGPIRVRLHNRARLKGLYWHRDYHAHRYHLVLWTNPGHFLVWTDKKMTFRPTYNINDCFTSFDINAKFLPIDGSIYELATDKYVHGVCNIGVGFEPNDLIQSRCHFTFWPIKVLNRY